MSKRRYVNPEVPVNYGVAAPSTGSQPILSRQAAVPVIPWKNPKMLDSPPCQPGTMALPNYFRSTVTAFPSNASVLTSSGIPVGLVINPAAVDQTQVMDLSDGDMTRCSRCGGYLSPYAVVQADNRTWSCPFCGTVNVHGGFGFGEQQRMESQSSVFTCISPKVFNEPPGVIRGPTFLFVVDMSFESTSVGYTAAVLSSIKASLGSMYDQTNVGLITMSDKVSVYDFRRKGVYVIADLDDIAGPDSILVPVGEFRTEIEAALDELLKRSNEADSNGHCYGSCLLIAEKVLKAKGGILMIFCTGYPTVGAGLYQPRVMDLTNPEALRVGETGSFYRSVGFALNRAGVSLHLFHLRSSRQANADLPLMGLPVGLTAGSLHHYPSFDPNGLYQDIFQEVVADYLWSCSARLRASPGIKVKGTLGNFSLRDNQVMWPIFYPQHSIGFEFEILEEIKSPRVVFQFVMVWTNKERKRLLRVMTFSLPVVNSPQVVRASLDEAAFITWLTKRVSNSTITNGASEAMKAVSSLLASAYSGTPRESLYHLGHSLLSSKLFHGASLGSYVDQMYSLLMALRPISLVNCLLWLYPRMYVVDGPPDPVPLASESFQLGTVILVHCVNNIYIWVSPSAQPTTLQSIFGNERGIEDLPTEVRILETRENQHLHDIINNCYGLSGRYLPVHIIPPHDEREAIFGDILVDLSTRSGSDLTSFISRYV